MPAWLLAATLSAGWQLGSVEGGAGAAHRRDPVILGALPGRQQRYDGEGILTAVWLPRLGRGPSALLEGPRQVIAIARVIQWAGIIIA